MPGSLRQAPPMHLRAGVAARLAPLRDTVHAAAVPLKPPLPATCLPER